MRHVTMNPHELKVRHYVAHLIDIDEYLDTFPGLKASDNIFETKLNEIIFNSIPDV